MAHYLDKHHFGRINVRAGPSFDSEIVSGYISSGWIDGYTVKNKKGEKWLSVDGGYIICSHGGYQLIQVNEREKQKRREESEREWKKQQERKEEAEKNAWRGNYLCGYPETRMWPCHACSDCKHGGFF